MKITTFLRILSPGLMLLPVVLSGAFLGFAQTPPQRTNGKIAFTSDRDGNLELYSINSDGTDLRRLTFNSGMDNYPAWSPDGMRIAYLSQTQAGQYFIKLMNADGGGQQTVTPVIFDLTTQNFCAERFSLSWSPGGNKIAFQEGGNIVQVNADGTNRQAVTDSPYRESEPSWGPRDAIAYVSTLSGGDNTNGLDIKTTSGSRYADYGYFTCSTSPDWSPDGTKLAYIHSYDFPPPGFIVIVATNGTAERWLTNLGARLAKPKWSPDGTLLAYEHKQFPAPSNIEIADEFGQNRRIVTTGTNPSWQPLVLTSCPNPIDCAEFFVRQHYLDFLNRESDPDGLAFWTNQIAVCGSDPDCIETKRINVSAASFFSIEFQESGYLVYRSYKASYGNLPNAPVPIKFNELILDTQQIAAGVIVNQGGWEQLLESNKETFFAAFVQRARFASAYPASLTPDQFVDLLFANAGVTPSANDRQAAINEFNSASNTADIAARARSLRRVAENATLAQREFNRAFVLMQYFGYLRRNPNDSPEPSLDFRGYNFWLNKLNQFNGDYVAADMVKAFLVSAEYRGRFGP
ncbi:MAG: TolB family protein [Pyrinomonadaceae bacterium]